MRMRLTIPLLILAVSGLAVAAGADTVGDIQLKDGSTLHIYKDGKMAMEDKTGKPMTMPQGTPMETKSGKIIMMKDNEVWRVYQSVDKTMVDDLMREGH